LALRTLEVSISAALFPFHRPKKEGRGYTGGERPTLKRDSALVVPSSRRDARSTTHREFDFHSTNSPRHPLKHDLTVSA
jgi:hypothetical protein